MNHVFVIAEAGVNHNGSLELARQLIDVACAAGADAVKFQSFKTGQLVSQTAPKAQYQMRAGAAQGLQQETQHDMLKKLELTDADHLTLINYCETKHIQFLSTPFDHDSIQLLAGLGMRTFKIPSGEITNLPYLRHIGTTAEKVILSTGMATLDEVGQALAVLTGAGLDLQSITVLHATTEYPCPMDEVNLHAMLTLRDTFGVKVGYSDHTRGIEIAIAAAALGARVIEKHFTLKRTMEGPDHKASLEPDELIAMVQAVRNVSLALGDGVKQPSRSEFRNLAVARKSIVARVAIREGEPFSADNLAAKRPGTGISPMHWDELIGQVAQRAYAPDELIQRS